MGEAQPPFDTLSMQDYCTDCTDTEKIHLIPENINDESTSSRRIRHIKSKSVPQYMGKKLRTRTRSVLIGGYLTLRRTAIEGTEHLVGAANMVARTIVKYSYKLSSISDLPDWLRDNIYIHHHLRPPLKTFRMCFRSIFSIHSETGNIWTHILGLIFLIAAMVFIFVRPAVTEGGYPYYPSGYQEVLCYCAFFVGGCLCLTFSWIFHTVCCHSQNVGKLFAKLDYSGISFLICGSMIPAFNYGFYCNYTLKVVYMSVALVMGVLCIIASLLDIMATPPFRPVRAGIFLLFGLSAIVPIVHHFMIYPRPYTMAIMQVPLLITMGSFYVSGCLLYTFLIPERFFPGKLNLAFQSHQIFHVFVVIGTFLHLYALCRMSWIRVRKGRICFANETEDVGPFF